jgi:hypothetical protein
VVRLRLDQPIARRFVDAARAHQNAVRPQHDAAVTGRAREDAALLDETGADAEPAGRGLDIEQAQLGCALVGAFDEEYGAHDLAFALGDPAALPLGIEALDEAARDLGDEALEGLVPAVLLGVAGG